MRMRALATACVSLAVMAGCGSTKVIEGDDTEGFAKKLIAEKAAIAAGAQRDYAALLAEDYSTVSRRQATFDRDTIDVDYIGSPKELIQTIASRYGYAFNELGRPIDLRPVNIRVKGVTPEDVLRNVGNQMDAGGDVVLNRVAKSITIEYKQRDSAGVTSPVPLIEPAPQAVPAPAQQKGG